MVTLTTLNGKTNRTWLKNRIANGTIVVQEIDYNNQEASYKDIIKEEALNLISNGMRIWESDKNKITGAYGTSFFYQFLLIEEKEENVKVLLKNKKTEIKGKNVIHLTNNNKLKNNKKMRNLITFAVMFSVMPSEADVEQLGFEPTKEDFMAYFSIPEGSAEDGSYNHSKDFDAYGDLYWMLNDEEKNILDPENVKADGHSTSEATTETSTDATTETSTDEVKEEGVVEPLTEKNVPEKFKAKFTEYKEEISLCKKELGVAEKALEKVKTANLTKLQKEEEKIEKAKAKVNKDKPETNLAVSQAINASNVLKKECGKLEKTETSKVNKLSASLIKAEANLEKLTAKIVDFNAAEKAKAEAKKLKADSKPKTEKKVVTELSRSQQIYVYAFEGRTAKMISELHPDWATSHIRNAIQTSRTSPERLTKALEIQKTLGLPESVKDSHKPAVVEKVETPAPATTTEETTEETK